MCIRDSYSVDSHDQVYAYYFFGQIGKYGYFVEVPPDHAGSSISEGIEALEGYSFTASLSEGHSMLNEAAELEGISTEAVSYTHLPFASSACEMVAEILQYIGDGVRLKQAEADAMYAGLMIDTNNFLSKTGVRTFEAAAFLKRSGADVTKVRMALRDDMKTYKALSLIHI